MQLKCPKPNCKRKTDDRNNNNLTINCSEPLIDVKIYKPVRNDTKTTFLDKVPPCHSSENIKKH